MKKSVYTGKMFKYLTIQRPILVIRVSKGVIKDLLEEIKASIYVTSTDEIKRILRIFYHEYNEKGQVCYHRKILNICRFIHR